jgi:glutamyl-tRNA synthetase
MSKKPIRVRFAPSPTGPLHIGGLRTALFNYLFAKNKGGKFILRIEDTDQTRFIEGAENYILESLEWCGILPDEGVGVNGEYGPYRQSERKDIYKEFALQLVASGKAYYAFDTPEELDDLRKEYELKKETFTYNARVRESLKNSLAIPEDNLCDLIESGKPYVIRFKFDENEIISMDDIIRGSVEVNSSSLDDKILFKSDGMPTYHLANVVDDYKMNISHVIRGEEWLPSLPLHVSLYKALGWEKEMPEFAHLPLILKPTGKGKLSKRDGDKGGFPVFPLNWTDPDSGEISPGYKEAGYFPEACLNILAFLGWNPGTEQELFNLEELIQNFDLEKVSKAGAKFDPDKAKWYNHQYLQKQSTESLISEFREILSGKGISTDDDYIGKVVDLVKERATFVSDFWEHSDFFFRAPMEYDQAIVKKRWKENTADIMNELIGVLDSIDNFQSSILEEKVKSAIEKNDWGMGAVMNAWRLSLVGTSKGPHLFDIAELIGKKETIDRMKKAIEVLS